MRNVPLKLVGCLLVFIAGTGPAAADQNYQPGIACLGSGTENNNIERQPDSGRAFNIAGAPRTLICPATRESGLIVRGAAWVIDRHPALGVNGRVTCWLRSGRPNSTVVSVSSDSTPVNYDSDIPARLDLPAVTSVPAGFHWISCDVPGAFLGQRSGVVTYQTFE